MKDYLMEIAEVCHINQIYIHHDYLGAGRFSAVSFLRKSSIFTNICLIFTVLKVCIFLRSGHFVLYNRDFVSPKTLTSLCS